MPGERGLAGMAPGTPWVFPFVKSSPVFYLNFSEILFTILLRFGT